MLAVSLVIAFGAAALDEENKTSQEDSLLSCLESVWASTTGNGSLDQAINVNQSCAVTACSCIIDSILQSSI